jgi:hypothetical protein
MLHPLGALAGSWEATLDIAWPLPPFVLVVLLIASLALFALACIHMMRP